MNKLLRETFLDYFNNYLTIEKYAEHNGLKVEEAALIIEIGKELHERHCQFYKELNLA